MFPPIHTNHVSRRLFIVELPGSSSNLHRTVKKSTVDTIQPAAPSNFNRRIFPSTCTPPTAKTNFIRRPQEIPKISSSLPPSKQPTTSHFSQFIHLKQQLQSFSLSRALSLCLHWRSSKLPNHGFHLWRLSKAKTKGKGLRISLISGSWIGGLFLWVVWQ